MHSSFTVFSVITAFEQIQKVSLTFLNYSIYLYYIALCVAFFKYILLRFIDLFDLASGTSSYNRAYAQVVRVQQLTEVEEVLEYRKLEKKHGTLHAIVKEHRLRMQSIWRDRILSCHQRVEVYVPILLVSI